MKYIESRSQLIKIIYFPNGEYTKYYLNGGTFNSSDIKKTRKSVSLDKAKNIINWEIKHAEENSDGDDPKHVQLMQDGMKVIWFDLNAYQNNNENLINLLNIDK